MQQTANGKFSLRNTISGNHILIKKELRICLKYNDLRGSQSLITNEEAGRSRIDADTRGRYRLYLREHKSNNVFNHLMCSITNKGQYSCPCLPQCHWINRWKGLANKNPVKAMSHSNSLSKEEWEKTVTQIEKDLPRTHSTHAAFSHPQYSSPRLALLR